MRLDQALVARGLCESRTEAQECIKASHVLINGIVSTKQTRLVSDADLLVVTKRREYVSRGGKKLHSALLHMYRDEESIRERIQGRTVLDIGSSTGGFTDCLLRYNVKHIDAVDVGTGQLHPSLRVHEKVSLYEETDIRHFKGEQLYDGIIADLSFISLLDILEYVVAFAGTPAVFFLLIKPQFEVGKGNTKKGIVKDLDLVKDVLGQYIKKAEGLGMKDVVVFPCSILGGDGNQEYFLYGKR